MKKQNLSLFTPHSPALGSVSVRRPGVDIPTKDTLKIGGGKPKEQVLEGQNFFWAFFSKHSFFSSYSSQQGVTLLLSILVLASVLAISFSMVTIIFIEFGSSRDLVKTEPAFYAAQGMAEQAIFNYGRKNSTTTYFSNFSNNVTLSSPPSVSSTSSPTFIDSVTTPSNFDNTTKRYSFCGAIATTSGCSIKKVVVTYINTNSYNDPLKIYLCQWDPVGDYTSQPCSEEGSHSYWRQPDQGGMDSMGWTAIYGQSLTSATWSVNIDPNLQQEMIITNPSGFAPIFYSVSTFDADGVTPKGLPFVGKTGVLINTQNSGVGRKLEVVIPTQ